jgi:CheY-like chemotaxis protein
LAHNLLRILVVDDDRDTAESTAMLMRLWGHEPRSVVDGPKALETARDFVPHALIIDLGMPGLDGWELARKLREESSVRAALFIAVSGFGMNEDRERSRLAGFHLHLLKPPDLDELRSILERLALM